MEKEPDPKTAKPPKPVENEGTLKRSLEPREAILRADAERDDARRRSLKPPAPVRSPRRLAD